MLESTICDIAILDLLEDFGPDCCVAFFVGFDCGGLEMDYLSDAADHFLLSFAFFLVSFGSVLKFVLQVGVLGW